MAFSCGLAPVQFTDAQQIAAMNDAYSVMGVTFNAVSVNFVSIFTLLTRPRNFESDHSPLRPRTMTGQPQE